MSDKPRILILDTYYPEVIRSMPINPAGTYDSELKAILHQSFGTADFYSRNLRALGWDAEDLIVNHEQLNSLRGPHFWLGTKEADVLFLQDLSIDWIRWPETQILAGQLSCPWPGDEAVRKCDVIFTSFPHYVARIEALGVKAVYNPLAFDPIVLERCDEKGLGGAFALDRSYDVVFIGGVGNPGHWKRGMETLNAVAEAIPTFKWWGYGDMNGCGAALQRAYQGQAWGLDMYRILLQSKIVLNRHGEVAEDFTNNMRCFEATGCGALLITEQTPNLNVFFRDDEVCGYSSADEAISQIRWFLDRERHRREGAERAQAHTLRDHTYAQRMRTVSETLKEMLNV